MKKYFLLAIMCALVPFMSGCATLLALPDEQTEDFYRNNSKITSAQITKNMTTSTGAKLPPPSKDRKIRLLPVVYSYTTYNTLKPNEEAYYTSRYTNHSWFRRFMLTAQDEIATQIRKRGYDLVIYNDQTLERMANGKDIEQVYRVAEARRGTPVRVAALNEDSDKNHGLVDRYSLRNYMNPSMDDGLILVIFDADWDPQNANTLNDDIVLNSNVKIGFQMVLCDKEACSEVNIPFEKGVTTLLPMPNKNTIDDDGLTKNHALINELHGGHLRQIIAEGFKKYDQQNIFSK